LLFSFSSASNFVAYGSYCGAIPELLNGQPMLQEAIMLIPAIECASTEQGVKAGA
jgi:hypothetical protein